MESRECSLHFLLHFLQYYLDAALDGDLTLLKIVEGGLGLVV
jgi:hypothetical protein